MKDIRTIHDIKPELGRLNLIADNLVFKPNQFAHRDYFFEEYYWEIFSSTLHSSGDVLKTLTELGRLKINNLNEFQSAVQILSKWLGYLDSNLSLEINEAHDNIEWRYNGEFFLPGLGLTNLTVGLAEIYAIKIRPRQHHCDRIIYWEKPETFCHPQLTLQFGTALTRICADHPELTIVIGTNDEPFLMGLRLGLKREYLPAEAVRIFFNNQEEGIIEIKIDQHGRINYWPKGFFGVTVPGLIELM